MRKIFIILLTVFCLTGTAQEAKEFGIKFSGFVKTDVFFDSRQTVDARDGHFLLYPQNELLDINGDDINAASKFNILAIQTRLKGAITGPDVFGAKTSGLIEGAFFGNISTDINGFRLRHAFVKLTWTKSELMVGQYWHPMFVTSCFPGTVSFNTGAPFQPFSRNPQIRFTKTFGKVSLTGTALTQVDFVDSGPIGGSTSYIINAAMPELNLSLDFKSKNVLFGVGINYKTLKPRLLINSFSNTLANDVIVKTDETVTGTSFYGYIKIITEPITIKFYDVAGQLMNSMTNLGGYAEKDIVYLNGDKNMYKTNVTYTPINTMSIWLDLETNGEKWQFGLLYGYAANLGSKDVINGVYYSRGSNIKNITRIAPRVMYTSGKFRVAPEIEYTVAAYGIPDEKGVVQDSKSVANFRFLVGVYYFF